VAITYLSSKRFLGDENDTKPVNVPDGSIFYEINSVSSNIISKFLKSAGIYEEISTAP